ncbi:MAG: lysylphosphatidylglycerol synthase transmembrane domain-containing protein [Verrucomicrobiota bacterium]
MSDMEKKDGIEDVQGRNVGKDVTKKSPRRLDWKIVLKLLVLSGILFYLFRDLDWATLGEYLTGAKPVPLLIAFFCWGILLISAGFRWNILLRVQGIQLPQKLTMQLTCIGHFFNSFLLGTTGGDVVKILYTVRYTPERKARAVLSIMMDRVIGLLVLLFIGALILPTQLKILSSDEDMKWMALSVYLLLAVGMLSVVVAYFFPLSWFPDFCVKLWKKIPQHDLLGQLYEGFKDHGRALPLTLQAIVLASVVTIANCTSGYFIGQAMGIQADYWTMAFIFATTAVVMGLPISLGGHGTREGALLFLFVLFGIIADESGKELPLAVSIIYLGIMTLWSLVGGAVYLLFNHEMKKEKHV